MAFKNKEKTVRKYFDRFTKDFKPDPNPVAIWVDFGANGTKTLYEKRIELPADVKIRTPYIVFIIFVKLLKFEFMGRWEKVAWEIPILYKEVPFILAHRKFGFTISFMHQESDADVEQVAIEAIKMIHKSIPYAEYLIAPQVSDLVNEGKITLANEYREIRDRYLFFRSKARKEFENKKKKDNETEMERIIREYYGQAFMTRAGVYYVIGMLDAYFSLLEHVLVLIVPFLKNKLPENITIENFISANWKEKYNLIFETSHDKDFARHLNELIKIKEQYRNPVSHGHFQKNGASIYVHMKNLGAIPMILTKAKSNLRYGFDEFTQITFSEVCAVFDAFDNFLDKHTSTKYSMQYIKTTFPVAFDEKSSKEYLNAMQSDKKFKAFLDYTGRELDNAANMDW